MKVYRIIWICSSLVLTIALLTPQPSIAQEKIYLPVGTEWTGQFSITNTSEPKLLYMRIWSLGIGTTHNVTITIHSNSSSGVNFSVTSIAFSESWDGLSEFQVFPNETFTTSYISHCYGDEPPGVKFHYSLIDSSKNASGTYHVLIADPGYQISIGTGYTCVSDISAWLNPELVSSPAIGFIVMSLVLLIVLIKRNRLKNCKIS